MRRPSKKQAAKAAKKAAKAKGANQTKPPSKAKKAVTKKAATKKKSTSGVLGCCTLVGSGPDIQREGVTKSYCEKLAAELGKNPIWTPGKCAQPDRSRT
ncbi:MAG TPA: hypothetical protein VNX23_02370 [Bradyrhizobium sp.]|jgi:hypothetical protein|uniref:hypothetical protein n=1 Tax=Bradyrhizobium sp. TaxID=376 RepID=UPI002D1763A6|nr:hypothetical protein [Bradyrhizobium sp.]HXB76248.1 hypothetical protein [Bradyrhizobium sp.]